MDACTNPEILKVIYFFLIIIDIVKIVIPIGLIIMGLIDFSKSVITSDEKVQKKTVSLFGKRILCAILVFIIPWIVEVLMVTLGDLLGDKDTVNFTDCIDNANAECIDALDSQKIGSIKINCDVSDDFKIENDEIHKNEKERCYFSKTDDKYVWGKYLGEDGFYLMDIFTTKKDCEYNEISKCYYDKLNGFVWGRFANVPNYEPREGFTNEYDCETGPKCYYYDGQNSWITNPKDNRASLRDKITNEEDCKYNQVSKCYYNKSNGFVWGRYENVPNYDPREELTNEEDCLAGEAAKCYSSVSGSGMKAWGRFANDNNYYPQEQYTTLEACLTSDY